MIRRMDAEKRGTAPTEHGGASPTGAAPRRRSLRSFTLDAVLFVLILGGAALLGFVPYRLEVAAARHEVQRKVLAVGRLKAEEVTRWLEERRADVLGAATGPQIALDVERWRNLSRADPVRREWVRGRLRRFRDLGGYAEVALAGLDGDVVLTSGAEGSDLAGLRRDDVRRAVATDAVVFSPISRVGDAIVMDAIAPLTAADARAARVVGALIYRIDVRASLYPIVRAWPTNSPSAEAFLVEWDAGSVRYLSDLRFLERAALTTKSVTDPRRVALGALRGARGLVEGLDYRGVPVLAWVDAVEGSPWIMVSKIDQAEVYAPLRDYLWIYLAFLTVAAVTAGVTTLMRQRAAREASLRREHDATVRYVEALEAAEAEREKLIASLTRALDDVKTLSGIVPICSSCKRIRDDAGYWKQVESFLAEHTEARFSHGVCPECARRLYPELATTPAPPAKPAG